MSNHPAVLLLLAFSAACLDVATGQGREQAEVSITTWYQGKSGAVSFSFDDGGYTQYLAAYPILEKYSLKATFSIVGEWVKEEPCMTAEPDHFEIMRMGWQQLLDLYNHGHELAAHGYLHLRYNKFSPVDELAGEMAEIISLIESRTHQPVFTLHYPYSYASGNIPEAARKAGFSFCRTGLDTINPASPADMHMLASQPILNDRKPDSVMFGRWLDQAEGNWLILMYHHLFSEDSREMSLIRLHNVENSYSLPPESFEEQVRKTIARDYWIAPIALVGKYILERDSTSLTVIPCKDKIIIVASTDLDTRVFNQPLTLQAEVPWKKVVVSGSLQDGILEAENNTLLIDVNPECVIILSKAR